MRFALGVALMLLCSTVVAAEIAGRIELFSAGRALRAGEAAEAVIYFRPLDRARLAELPTVSAEMITRRKQFVPRILAITVGSEVRFPNQDPILHNVFSTSPDNAFDAGVYGTGEGVTHRFQNPGLVKVYCNVHHSMFAYILVLDTPHFTRADAEGRFALTGLTAGAGELVVYHDRARPWRRTLEAGSAGEQVVRLDLDRRLVPVHTNKFGKPYGAAPTNDQPY